MRNQIFSIAYIFCFGSLAGWILEFVFRLVIPSPGSTRRIPNPGFCSGPYLPLYGTGLCLIYLIVNRVGYGDMLNRVAVCLILTVAMTLLELITGLISVNIFHVRLWDYRNRWLNFNGIVCPLFSLIWGIIVSVYYLYIHEYMDDLVKFMSSGFWSLFFLGLFYGIFLVDLGYSLNIVTKLRKFAKENNVTVIYERLKSRMSFESDRLKFLFPLKSPETLKNHLIDVSETLKNTVKTEREELLSRLDKDDFTAWYIKTSDGEKLISVKQILIFIPCYLAAYVVTSRGIPIDKCYPVYCHIDEMLPVCNLFVIPYITWHAMIPFLAIYFFKTDLNAFRRMAKYFMYTIFMVMPVFILFPSCMPLRPSYVEVKGALSWILSVIYTLDVNTNVCPSVHVLWGIGMLFAVWDDKRFSNVKWRVFWTVITVLICASTFMIKQHSVIDVAAALPFVFAGWFICYRKRKTPVSED